MLQVDHRGSHDFELFLDDPQLLPYVEAMVSEMQFEIGPATCNGDGHGHLKVSCDGFGEIAFFVTGHVTDDFARAREVLGRGVLLKTVPEIIAKKIRFRGSRIQPRDMFDIAAADEAGYGHEIKAALAVLPDDVAEASEGLAGLAPEYVETIVSQFMIRPDFESLVPRAYSVAQEFLAGY